MQNVFVNLRGQEERVMVYREDCVNSRVVHLSWVIVVGKWQP